MKNCFLSCVLGLVAFTSAIAFPQSKRGIRSVDFRNFVYDNVDGKRVVLRRGRNLKKGEFSVGEYGSQLDKLRYVDFDGDGNAEAFIVISTSQEAAGAYWAGDCFVFAHRDGRPVQIFHETRYKPTGISLAGTSIILSAYFWRDQDAHCCPHAIETSVYRWRGAGFSRVSRKLKLLPKT